MSNDTKPEAAETGQAPPAPEFTKQELAKRAAASRGIATAFGEIVSVLARSKHYRQHMLADLEWLVTPAIGAGQFAKADARHKVHGFTTPVAIVLWAKVSDEIDKELSSSLDKPIRLKPADWRSGEHAWVIVAEGEARSVATLLQQVKERVFKDVPLKARAAGPNGKPIVAQVALKPRPAGAPQS